MPTLQFAFDHDPRFAPLLRPFGVRPDRAGVEVDDDRLRVRYGVFSVTTPRSNVADAQVLGPFRWWKAVGPRLSLADRGATYGTTAAGGVCITFVEPVTALPPVRSPALTVTVADRDGLIAALTR